MVIKKKAWPKEYEAVQSGAKTFDLRLQDFDVSEGDTLILEEWDPDKEDYTGRTLEKKVGYVFRFSKGELPYWPKEDVEQHGVQILSLVE